MLAYFKGQVSKKEFSKAIGIHYNQQFKWIKWTFGIILAILLVSLIITVIRDPSIGKSLFPGMIFPFALLSFPWWTPYLQSSSYDQKGNIYRSPIEGFIDETGITINGQDVKVNVQWKAFTHYIKSEDMVLLYQSKNCFNIFTKALFSEEDWARFTKRLEESFPQK